MTKHIPDRFTLGHSPDPDDAFMFYAMAENKIDLRGYRFDHRLEHERIIRIGGMTQGKAVGDVLRHLFGPLIICLSGSVNNRRLDDESDAKTRRSPKALRAKSKGTACSVFAKLWSAYASSRRFCAITRLPNRPLDFD